jgi:phosphotransferase system enzyme I (PtsI)
MEIKKGIAVSPGVAICPAVVLDADDLSVPRRTVARAKLKQQRQRLDEALAAARKDVEKQRQWAEKNLGTEQAAVFGFHLGMLHDRHLIDQVHKLIETEEVTAEYALATVFRKLGQTFQQMADPLFRERVSDIWDLERRVLRHLIAEMRHELENLNHEAIVVARDLTPSQTAGLDRRFVKALATDAGGRTSHTAIMARALNIPAVVGLEDVTSLISPGDTIIVDGNRGLVIVNPTTQQLDDYRDIGHRIRAAEKRLAEGVKLPAVTLDGQKIDLLANIEFNNEIAEALKKGAEGVGLYRTEYLYLAGESDPTEKQQYDTFVEAVKLMEGRPLTIRTLDLGADKYTRQQASDPEPNPFLGLRSIRLCLAKLPLFKTHLRAILRASAHGPIKLMFPLITSLQELRQARMLLHDVMEDLDEQGLEFDRKIPVGMMMEVPSAALMAQAFVHEVDFFSIGTNDLVQYTLAVDRSNEHVASLYSPAHPAVIELIKSVIRAANRGQIDVSCCGEMAGDVEYAMLLIGLGLRSFSMTPQAVPEVKQLIRAVSVKDCERVARKALSYDTDRQVLTYLREEARKALPEVFEGRSIE